MNEVLSLRLELAALAVVHCIEARAWENEALVEVMEEATSRLRTVIYEVRDYRIDRVVKRTTFVQEPVVGGDVPWYHLPNGKHVETVEEPELSRAAPPATIRSERDMGGGGSVPQPTIPNQVAVQIVDGKLVRVSDGTPYFHDEPAQVYVSRGPDGTEPPPTMSRSDRVIAENIRKTKGQD